MEDRRNNRRLASVTGGCLLFSLLYSPHLVAVTFPSTGDSRGKINPFLPTRCRPTVEHSLAAGDAKRQWLQAHLPNGHQPQCLFSP
jgi:hypothetical protein